ncbi:DUF2281 domain-containing protein [Sphaerospermopsis sp. LEGE 08334]|jgi:hypothetical protein|uniref:DUF2281 domain-containing protein n=1 Tax=Sphaerospermopsis sp. LEGE 08334 TaxID=1828651 RepID=UPI001881E4F4|nr:DUF2281 domain-containing protein [Sphaerospermopsis sp. LEGE 08334]MBE9055342.1 DUF2281 domain-containing protein [Sphaerospermopsis sp. LEGE 08334]
MTIEQAVLENFRELPADKQQEVLDFIQFLKHQLPAQKRRTPPASIAGKGKTLGDIVSPIVNQEEWENSVKNAQAIFRKYIPTTRKLSEELIQERREESLNE